MKKIGLISLVLVLALGALGVGYAAWTDTLTISGTVTTGSVLWEFADSDLMDEHPGGGKPVNFGGDYPTNNPDNTSNVGFPFVSGKGYFWELDKNVAWGEQLLVDTDDPLDGHYDTLEVTLWNTYPSYFNELTFYVHNYGTMPLKVDHIMINGQKITQTGQLVRFDFNDDGQDDFEIMYGDNFGVQIEPSGGAGVEFSLWMHVLQPAPQDMLDELHFTIQIVAVQWNEHPLP